MLHNFPKGNKTLYRKGSARYLNPYTVETPTSLIDVLFIIMIIILLYVN